MIKSYLIVIKLYFIYIKENYNTNQQVCFYYDSILYGNEETIYCLLIPEIVKNFSLLYNKLLVR